MDLSLVVFALLLVVGVWSLILGHHAVQKVIHRCGLLAAFLQWYSLMILIAGALFVATFWQVFVWEYDRLHFLTISDLGHVPDLTEQDRTDLAMPAPLKYFSLLAPIAALACCCIVVEHTFKMIQAHANRVRNRSDELDQQNEDNRSCLGSVAQVMWALPREKDCEMLVITMPMVFITLALRALIRIWAIMTGSALSQACLNGMTWSEIKTLELATYTADLEMAGFFQYWTVYSFTCLCMHLLRFQGEPDALRELADAERPEPVPESGWRWLPCFPSQDVRGTELSRWADRQNAFKQVGFQGVWLYVVLGICRALGAVFLCLGLKDPQYNMMAAVYQDQVLTFISPIFTIATLLCIYNMMIICKTRDIQSCLPNAYRKFLATRALLLVQQVQQNVLLGLVVDAPLYSQLEEQHLVPAFVKTFVKYLDLSVFRAKLSNVTLLCFECLLVVSLNRLFWRPGSDYTIPVTSAAGSPFDVPMTPGPSDAPTEDSGLDNAPVTPGPSDAPAEDAGLDNRALVLHIDNL